MLYKHLFIEYYKKIFNSIVSMFVSWPEKPRNCSGKLQQVQLLSFHESSVNHKLKKIFSGRQQILVFIIGQKYSNFQSVVT